MIKQGNFGYPKMDFHSNLENEERGDNYVATSTIDGEMFICIAWRGKNDKSISRNNNNFFI